MKVLFLAYPQYADFEVGHPLFFLRKFGKAEITTATVDGKSVESLGGLRVSPQVALPDVDVREYQLVLISGGDGVDQIEDEPAVAAFLQGARAAGVPIAAICASAVLLGKAGLLAGQLFTCTPNTYEGFRAAFEGATYTGERVQVGDGYVTAQGTAFAEFTVEMGRLVGLWPSEQRAQWALDFCKGNIG